MPSRVGERNFSSHSLPARVRWLLRADSRGIACLGVPSTLSFILLSRSLFLQHHAAGYLLLLHLPLRARQQPGSHLQRYHSPALCAMFYILLRIFATLLLRFAMPLLLNCAEQ
jgi:hypothetical protein